MWLGAHDIIKKKYLINAIQEFYNNKNYVLVYQDTKLFINDINKYEKYDCSLIDTCGLNCALGMKKVLNNISEGTPYHGLFKNKVLKNLPIYNIEGTDFLTLFCSAEAGEIRRIKKIGYLRRKLREENYLQQQKRHGKMKIKISKNSNRFANLFIACSIKILLSHKFSFLKKINLVLSCRKILKNRFFLTWKEVYRQMISNYEINF